MLERGIGVAIALKHDRLALVRVEEDFVLERAFVLCPDDVHGLGRQALPFLQLAGEEFDAGDAFDFVHCWSPFESASETIVPGQSGFDALRSARGVAEK